MRVSSPTTFVRNKSSGIWEQYQCRQPRQFTQPHPTHLGKIGRAMEQDLSCDPHEQETCFARRHRRLGTSTRTRTSAWTSGIFSTSSRKTREESVQKPRCLPRVSHFALVLHRTSQLQHHSRVAFDEEDRYPHDARPPCLPIAGKEGGKTGMIAVLIHYQ